MRRLRGITSGWMVTALLAASAAAIAGCGSHGSARDAAQTTTTKTATTTTATVRSTPHPELGPFAGYGWNVDVHSVHARWIVPRLAAHAPAGQAAAWVGAEAPGALRHAPFVQVGVHEGNTGGRSPGFYYAFYSTTKRHFRPLPLFTVRPGETVSATLRRVGRRWRIEIDDVNTGRKRVLFSSEGAGRTFNDALVDQEDVTDSRTGEPYPYPGPWALRFSHVSVNGGVPDRARRNSSWLTEPDGYLAPGPLRDGAFALGHVTMTPAAYRYLRAIAAQDAATTSAGAALQRWATGGPSAPARGAAARLRHIARRTERRLRTTRWPPAARAPIRALCADVRRLASLLAGYRVVPLDERLEWAERFDSLLAAIGDDGRAARRALRLPSAALLPAG
jgi:hypothetical protein